MRPRVVKDEAWTKDAPQNAIWWAVNGRVPQSPLFNQVDSENDDDSDQYLGSCIFCITLVKSGITFYEILQMLKTIRLMMTTQPTIKVIKCFY